MDVRITPTPLHGTLPAMPSKSDAHRKLICAAFSDAPTRFTLPEPSADLATTLRCLTALGAQVRFAGERLTVSPAQRPASVPLLDCGESGSTLRFLLPVAAAFCPAARFTGAGRLPQRPVGPLLDALRAHGVSCPAQCLPLETQGLLSGGIFSLPGDISSQFVTGLLLALPLTPQGGRVSVTTALGSASYVDITITVQRAFGVAVAVSDGVFSVPGGCRYRSPGVCAVEGDWSNAAFFLVAGALAGGGVTVTGLSADSPQGDRAAAGLLARFGAAVRVRADSVTVSPAPLHGCAIDIGPVPDLLPALAVAAACADGPTRFYHAARLRLKESDRLESVAAMLRALGGRAAVEPDALTVCGGGLFGGCADSAGDHRIAMAAAIAAIACSKPVAITGAQAVEKSYPAFFRDYSILGGNADVL